MSYIAGAFILPHPPIIVKEVGKGHETSAQATVNAADEAARRIADLKPQTIIIITPHGNMLSDAVNISGDDMLFGSFAGFGAPHIRLELKNDRQLVGEILQAAERENLMVVALDSELRKTYGFSDDLDHGALVPIYFIQKHCKDFMLVHITYSMLPHEEHYRVGKIIREAVEGLGRRTVIVCSGDLSHRLTKDAPAGYSPKGAKYDADFVELIKSGDASGLLDMDCELVEEAEECALRAAVVLYGALDGCSPKGEILSYEGPFGVGYCVAQLHLNCRGESTDILENYVAQKKERLMAIRSREDAYVRLARTTLEAFVRDGSSLGLPKDLPKEMLENKAGVFVSIKKQGELRGCIGTISPTTDSVAKEIMQNAVSAGSQDPRFYPVDEDELEELQYSVDVLMEPEDIDSKEQLDVRKYGVIVRKGYKSGLLLPNLEGVDTVEEQLAIVLQKAGIRSDQEYKMQRFEVIRHK